jgi:structural maintenance of chromosome 3 (chondroitin sulfate proteoglycan 6)
LNQLASSIADKQGELDGLKPKFQSVLEEENQLMSEIRIAEQKCKELHAKLGYREQFKSKAERDTYLKKELNFLDRQNDETEDQITKIQKTITEDDKDFERLQSQFLV